MVLPSPHACRGTDFPGGGAGFWRRIHQHTFTSIPPTPYRRGKSKRCILSLSRPCSPIPLGERRKRPTTAFCVLKAIFFAPKLPNFYTTAKGKESAKLILLSRHRINFSLFFPGVLATGCFPSDQPWLPAPSFGLRKKESISRTAKKGGEKEERDVGEAFEVK